MDKKFAVKLIEQQNNDSSNLINNSKPSNGDCISPSRKRTMSTEASTTNGGSAGGVNVFTVSADGKEGSGDVNNNKTKEQFVIIHLPKTTEDDASSCSSKHLLDNDETTTTGQHSMISLQHTGL